jgi:preprotein translocase subunit SecG
MDSGVTFAIVLTILFFGAVIWLVIHARKQDEVETEEQQQGESNEPKRGDQPDVRQQKAS